MTHWTIRDLDCFTFPARGGDKSDSCQLSPLQEGGGVGNKNKLKDNDGVLTLGGKPVSSYRFKENYYFMAGDNSGDSGIHVTGVLCPNPSLSDEHCWYGGQSVMKS